MDVVTGNSYVQEIIAKVGPLFSFLFFGAEIIAIIAFAAMAVWNTVNYFKNQEDPREQKEYKTKIKNSLIGLGVAFVASILFNLILSLVGINIFTL